jgi:hypothetical protein
MHRKARERDEEQRWRGLKRWLKASQAQYGALMLKCDDGEALNDWECERSTLYWAIRKTPAKTLRALRVKALAVQAFSTRPGQIFLSERRTPEIELAEEILRTLITMEKSA